jgi:Uma2 family endonuclease
MQTTTPQRVMTAEDFEQFSLLPENAERRLELIEGEVTDVVSNDVSSEIAMLIGTLITMYVRAHKLGRVTGADGGYVIGNDRYIPDVAFVSSARQARASGKAYNPVAPDLAVEVLSPTDDPAAVRIKVSHYLSAGTTVWVVDPAIRRIEVYAPGLPGFIAREGDTLSGGDVLPGFSLAVSEIFPA